LRYRKLLYAWSAATVGNVLCIPFSVVAVKNGYGVSDFNALFFVLCQLIGGVVASSLNIWIMDRVGPRPMLILYNGGLMLTALLWIFSPLKLNIIYLANIFFINGMALAGTNTAISHYFLVVVPERERVVVNMFFLIFSGAATGLAGTILGGGLLKLLSSFDLTALTVYRTFFSFILIFLCPLFLIIKKLDRLDSYRVKEVLKIFLSFRDLRSLFMLHRFERE
jgi:MFS family permease